MRKLTANACNGDCLNCLSGKRMAALHCWWLQRSALKREPVTPGAHLHIWYDFDSLRRMHVVANYIYDLVPQLAELQQEDRPLQFRLQQYQARHLRDPFTTEMKTCLAP